MALACSAIAAGSLAATGARAQDAPRDVEDLVVITASRTGLEEREIGSAISIVTAVDIEAGQIIAVKELLQDVPGMQISTGLPGQLTSVSIRGSDNDQVLFLLDGIELGDPSTISTEFQADHLTAMDVERVEVLRGNQSSLYGSDAVGGVVNIITRRATEEGVSVNVEAEAGGYLRAADDAGGHTLVRGAATALGRTGPADFRLTLSHVTTEGPSNADPHLGFASEEDDAWINAASGRLGLELGDMFSTQIVGFYNETSTDFDFAEFDLPDHVDKEEAGGALQLLHASTDDTWSNALTLASYDVARRYFGDFNLPEGDLFEGTKSKASYVLSFRPSDLVGLAAGLDYEEESTDQLTLFSGSFAADIDTSSAFAELALTPADPLTVTVAARHDDNSRFGEFDTYRATGAYIFPDLLAGGDVKLRASYGTGAKAPGLYQLFDPVFGNPDLEPEESEGYDAGVDVYWGAASLELTVFDTEVSNEIDFDTAYIQRGETSARGMELGVQAPLGSWLTLAQSFTVQDVEDVETGLWLGRPRYSGATSVTLAPTDRWDLATRLRYRSDNASGFGGTTEGFVVVDLLGSFEVGERFEVFGRVVNALDHDYQMSFGQNELDRAAYIGVRARLP